MKNNKKISVIIPARMGSSRFPGKPLAKILGYTMIEHIYWRTLQASQVRDVFVATCDTDIYKAVESFGGKAVMTSAEHLRATDRIAEAALIIGEQDYVMVQGDEPMVNPNMINKVIEVGVGNDAQCVNLIAKIKDYEEFISRNTIKVILDSSYKMLYMSREPIPTDSLIGFSKLTAYKQVCVMYFKYEALMSYCQLKPADTEIAESIDMLRFSDNGIPVHLSEVSQFSHAVDTPEDLMKVEALMKNDDLTIKFLQSKLQ